MSYIRGTTNPEALYIVGTGKNVEIYRGGKGNWVLPYTMPTEIFNTLLHLWNKGTGYSEVYRGAMVREVPVRGTFRIELSYKDWKVRMWPVTWAYICDHEKDG
jgi:hypothetical protein